MCKIIACIECAPELRANSTHVMREYKAGEGVPCYHDKLMSGSSLEVKTFLRNHKTLISKASTSALVTS